MKIEFAIEILFLLDRNLEKVDHFYHQKEAETSRRLRLLRDRYPTTRPGLEALSYDDIEELIDGLAEVRTQCSKIGYFGEINRRGFIKITKKLDKKIPHAMVQQAYLQNKVFPKEFASNSIVEKDKKDVSEWLSLASVVDASEGDTGSVKSMGSTRIATSSATIDSKMVDDVETALKQNHPDALKNLLDQQQTRLENLQRPTQEYHDFLLGNLQRAISQRSLECIPIVLARLDTLDEPNDIDHRTCVHRLIRAMGRSQSNESAPTGSRSPIMSNHFNNSYLAPTEASSHVASKRGKSYENSRRWGDTIVD